MSKTIIVITLLAGATAGYSQGQIEFYNYGGGQFNMLRQAIFSPSTLAASTYSVTYGGYTTFEEIGSTSGAPEKPTGSTVYTGVGLTGTGYDGQLLAGPAGIKTVGGAMGGIGLMPVGTVENFRTVPALAGMLNGAETITLPTESYFTPGDLISVAIASWANSGPNGPAPTLAQAQADGYAWGVSPVEQTTQELLAPPNAPAQLPTTIVSFSLGIPEPATISLGVAGALTLLFRRRK